MIKFVLLDNYFSNLFTEAQIWYWKTLKFDLGRFFLERQSKFQPKWLFLKIRVVNVDMKIFQTNKKFVSEFVRKGFWKVLKSLKQHIKAICAFLLSFLIWILRFKLKIRFCRKLWHQSNFSLATVLFDGTAWKNDGNMIQFLLYYYKVLQYFIVARFHCF